MPESSFHPKPTIPSPIVPVEGVLIAALVEDETVPALEATADTGSVTTAPGSEVVVPGVPTGSVAPKIDVVGITTRAGVEVPVPPETVTVCVLTLHPRVRLAGAATTSKERRGMRAITLIARMVILSRR